VSEGGRQGRPGQAPEAGELRDANDETFVPGEAPKDRGWALNDRMRMVRAERQSSASQIHRSLTAWRKESGAGGGGAAQAQIPKAGGAPLGADVRKSMEGRLGADLSNVKVHTGGDAAGAAEGLQARAFTVGEDVHFGAGQFAPGTKEGDRLLAHELTHVVQGQRSGIQRKADDGAQGGGGKSDAGEHKDGGAGGADHEVSQPGDPAEHEADAVADNVAEGLHGEKKDDKAKGKGKGKDDDKQAAGGHDAGGGAGDGDHGAHAHGDAPAGAGGAQSEAKGGGGDAKGGAQSGGEVKQGPQAPISAKLISRKIFRTKKPSPTTKPATGPGVDPAKQAQIDKAKSCKTPADVKAICAADPIATQKLKDVDGETNMEGGKNPSAEYYAALAGWIQSNGATPTFNPATIFNQCMNNLAGPWKFKGEPIKPKNLGKAVQRTQGVKGFYYKVVDNKAYEEMFKGAPNAKQLAYDKWLSDAKTDPLKYVQKDKLEPGGGTWFTPDSYKLTDAKDAGYNQLLELAALQPEWFPEGNVVFSVDVAKAASQLAARKPTAYDGMQSALWVSRPGPDTFGVTGGGANEFLCGDVPKSAITSAKLVVPEPALQQELQDAVKASRDAALAEQPELKKAIDTATDEKVKKSFEAMVPQLTDVFLRGAPGLPLSAQVRQALAQIKDVTDAQRKNPSAARAAGDIVAPSVAGAGAGPAAPAAGAGAAAGAAAGKTAAGGSSKPKK
jgi:hypothetical protein